MGYIDDCCNDSEARMGWVSVTPLVMISYHDSVYNAHTKMLMVVMKSATYYQI